MKAYEIQSGQIPIISPQTQAQAHSAEKQVNGGESFSQVFDRFRTRDVRFSKHADTRLNSREISFSEEQIARVRDGVMKAGAKGIIDGLVLVDGVALVVNVPSATVVTAMDGREAIITNIDGAVIV